MSFRSLESRIPTNSYLDTLDSYCRKYERISRLENIGMRFEDIKPNSKVSKRIKDRLKEKRNGLTSGFYATNTPFGFVILRDNKKDYRFASFTAYGLKNHKKELLETSKDTLDSIFEVCPVTSFDLAFDTPTRPNIEALKPYGYYEKCFDTHYINKPNLYGVERIIMYDKSKKENLSNQIWRLELRLPLNGVKLKDYDIPMDSINQALALCGVDMQRLTNER